MDVAPKTPIAEGGPSAADGGTVGTGSRGSGGLGAISIAKPSGGLSRTPGEGPGEGPFTGPPNVL